MKPRILNISLMVEADENGFTKAMRKAASDYREINPSVENFNDVCLKTINEFEFDICFIQIQRECVLKESTAIELAKKGFVINWTGDIREVAPRWMLDIGRYIQLTAFSNMTDVRECNLRGVKSDWLDIGYDPERFKNYGVVYDTPDIVAHFNHYGSDFFPLSQFRIDVVNRLKKEFGDNFGVYGNFPGANGNFGHSQIDESKNYSSAKIAINISHFNYEKYSSDRILRILGTGGAMCLSHEYQSIHEMYEYKNYSKKQLDVFENVNELVAKCKYYLNNEQERKMVAKNGQERVLNSSTFDNMAQNIIQLYKKWK